MSEYSLTDQFIDDTYPGLLHAGKQAIPPTGVSDIYDGAGNKTPLKLGRESVSLGELEYPTSNGGAEIGSVLVQTATNKLEVQNKPSFYGDILNFFYPIGSIYFSTDEINPQNRFPNTTWEKVSEGMFIVGVGTSSDGAVTKSFTVGNNAGEHEHKLTIDELPIHTHSLINPDNNEQFYIINDSNFSGGPAGTFRSDGPDKNNDARWMNYLPSTGSDKPHNNLPPSYGLHIWKRTL